jgi:hypothetical protein
VRERDQRQPLGQPVGARDPLGGRAGRDLKEQQQGQHLE